MPFYEYECASCKFYTEVMQKITDAPLRKCPSCGKNTLKKLVSAPVFRLKGGGWYETDFKSDKENKRNLAAGEKEEAKPDTPKTPSEATASSSSDTAAKPAESKPAAAKESAPSEKRRKSVTVSKSAPRKSVKKPPKRARSKARR